MTVFGHPMMPVITYYSVKDVAKLLHRSDSDIKEFARRAKERFGHQGIRQACQGAIREG
jgi:hypothetical protein